MPFDTVSFQILVKILRHIKEMKEERMWYNKTL